MGSTVWGQVCIQPLKSKSGKIIGIIGTIVDISELKLAELALRESETKFQLLFDQAPLGYQSLDSEGRVIEVNQQWLDLLGYTREEVIGKWYGYFLPPKGQERFRRGFPGFKKTGTICIESKAIHKNGSILSVTLYKQSRI